MSDSMFDPQLTRRGFMKVSGGLMALAVVGDTIYDEVAPQIAEGRSETVADEWVYSACRQCVLPPCGIKVKVQDGVVVKVEGNPATPSNQGTLCSRGNATIAAVYNPYRVKSPLKRTNPKKGITEDPGWVEITWDEALDTIAEKLKTLREDDPRKFMWCNGFARAGSMLEGMEFCKAYGTPNYIEVDGPNCSIHFGSSLLLGNFIGPNHDPVYTEYLLLIGQGSTASSGYAPQTRAFANSLRRGMKVVAVEPRCSVEASKGEWVPIKPGTDLAFVLALQHVIVHELNRFDVQFLKTRTNAPYLIGKDGKYVRDAESNKPLMWAVEAEAAKPFDSEAIGDVALEGEFKVDGAVCHPAFQLYKEQITDYTPEWAEEITTIPASTIRRIAREFVDAARIGSTIMLEGTPFPYRPVCLESGRGSITQFYGANYHCAAIMVNMLVGALDVPGAGRGELGPPHKSTPIPMALQPDADGVVAPKVEAVRRDFIFPPENLDGKTFFPYSHDNPHITFDAILEPEKYYLEYEPSILFVWGGNPVLRMYDSDRVLEAMNKFDFVFTLSYSLDEPAQMADIVLPESTGLERWVSAGRAAVMNTAEGYKQAIFPLVQQQVIEPVYNTRQPDDVFIALAERVGILYGPDGINALLNTAKFAPVSFAEPFLLDTETRYTAKELANRAFKSGYGEEADIDALRNSPQLPMKVLPHKSYYPYGGFPGSQTRYALYMEHLLRMGEDLVANLKAVDAVPPGWTLETLSDHFRPLVHWIEDPREFPEEYNFRGVNWKTAQYSFGNGGTAENPWLEEASRLDPYLHLVCMNRQAAIALGFEEGDEVIVESVYGGKIKGKLKLAEAFHPSVIGVAGLFGHRSKQMNPIALKGLHFNALMSHSPRDIDPVGGGFDGAPHLKVYKV